MAGPGVVVTTATKSGPTAPVRAVSGQVFMVGMAERGSVAEPIVLGGMADYELLMGGRVSYGALFDNLRTFFAEGGSRAYVARVVGPAATTGFLNLLDRAAVPVNTLRVEAANPGAWSANITVEVAAGAAPGTYRLLIRENGVVVEDANNLTNPAQAELYFRFSPYIRVLNLASATAAPSNIPALIAATPLSAGTDDRAAVTAATHTTALSRFDGSLNDGAVAIPGQSASAVGSAIDLHCRLTGRIGILAGARSDGVAGMTALAGGFNTEYTGLFGPHIVIPDDVGGRRVISPEGYVAACRNRAHEEIGAWRAPAGHIAVGRFVLGVDQAWSTTEIATLDASRVNAIRVISNTVRLYGWRSLSLDVQNYSTLNSRDLLNRITKVAEERLENYVFETIDGKGRLLSSVNAELVGIVEPIRSAGGLYELYDGAGQLIDPGYEVDTGPNVNTLASRANNEVRARLAVRISPIGALVSLVITKVGITAAI